MAEAGQRGRYWTEAKHRKVTQERGALAQVARRAMPAVASINTLQPGPSEGDEPQRGMGAGFVIHEDGYILTSAHVIEGATEIKISLVGPDGFPREYPAQVVGQDDDTDFALLKIKAGRKLPVLPLGHSRQVGLADWVVLIGNPFGLAHSVSVGVVSYIGRTDVTPSGRSGYFDYLQTDAPINPGNSGGPMLNLHGEVVGIANAVNVAGQGIGFAIPVDTAKAVLPQLFTKGKVDRGWMGISVQDLTPDLAKSAHARSFSGVLVSNVLDGSPASLAGLQVGDVITQVGQAKVRRAHALRWEVATKGSGRKVALKVRRDGKPILVSVQLKEPPPRDEADAGDSVTEPSVAED